MYLYFILALCSSKFIHIINYNIYRLVLGYYTDTAVQLFTRSDIINLGVDYDF